MRGSDIPYNPVFFAYLVLPTATASRPTLFIDLDQVPQGTYDYLTQLDVLIEPYDDYINFLEGVSKVLSEQVRPPLLDLCLHDDLAPPGRPSSRALRRPL